jgi:hypothetical protein
MKNENLAYFGAIATFLCVVVAVVVLLITQTLTLEQVGPFLLVLIAPLTVIAGLPIFKAALAAPSADQLQQVQQQNQQLHTTLSQSIQALAQVAQPVAPTYLSVPDVPAVAPMQSVQQVPFPTPVNSSAMIYPQGPQGTAIQNLGIPIHFGDTGLMPAVPPQ